ncbi:S-layer homology domain-containing protein [Lysobacter claricitrinus]|uniref:S-layer homology domain-containing protein n=1 Tax=Lysobacter claricitrinus TaxID=3367728 RepID=UPI0038B3BBC7
MVVDPFRPSRLYALSTMGGVFRTDDAGGRWTFVSQLAMQLGRLEISATDADTLYAYSNADRDETYPTSGIFKSTDAGATWSQVIPGPASPKDAAALQRVDRVRTVAGRSGLLLAASRDAGILRSVDGGSTWSAVLKGNGQPANDCSALELAPDRNRFYAVCATQVLWSPIDSPLLAPLTSSGLADTSDRLKLAVAPTDGNVLYVAATKTPQGHSRLIDRIYRSTDGGVQWQTVFQRALAGENTPPVNSNNPFNIALPGIFGRDCANPSPYNYFEEYQLAVDPRNANVVWIAGGQIYRSDDGAATFGLAGTAVESNAAIAFATGYASGANNRVFTAGADGVKRTDNARDALQAYPASTCDQPGAGPSVTWADMVDGYSAGEIIDGSTRDYQSYAAVSYNPSTYYGETIVGNDGSANSWSHVNVGEGSVLFGRESAPTVYMGGGNYVQQSQLIDLPPPVWASGDYWFPGSIAAGGFVFPSLENSNVVYTRNSYPVAQHPATTSKLAIPTAGGAMVSTDGGETWEGVGLSVSLAAVAFRSDGSLLGVTSDGRIMSEAVPGQGAWEQRDLNGCVIGSGSSCAPERARMQNLVRDPVPGSNGLYGAGNDRAAAKVYYSADGRVWQALDHPGQAGSLPNYVGMTSIAVDPNNSAVLYAGTPAGLYVTTDRGNTWTLANSPFGGVPVSKVTLERNGDGGARLFAFTYGRGIWMRELPQSTDFADVPTYHWAYNFIGRLYRAGVTSGCGASPRRYCPDSPVSRDQMAVFLERATRGTSFVPSAAIGTFQDVPTTHWAAPWIEQLARDGITTGCSAAPRLYCPDSAVTRDQMAVFILRAVHGPSYQPPAAIGVFEDVPVEYWAAPWIEQLAREGVTSGCSAAPKLYCPGSVVTRDQMAVFLVRGFNL